MRLEDMSTVDVINALLAGIDAEPDGTRTVEVSINGKEGLLVEVPDTFSTGEHYYGACKECGLCSTTHTVAEHAFVWLQRHLTGHPEPR
jgi:hypothetical protein